jgi:urease subunit alpha
MFGAFGRGMDTTCLTFVSQAAIDGGVAEKLGLKRRLEAVRNTRNISKADMKLNDYQPDISVDPQTYVVKADAVELLCEPADELPLAQRYYLF